MPPHALAVFDFDGTLADSFHVFRRCLDEAATVHGFRPIAAHEAERVRRMSSRELMTHLDVPLWKVPTLAVDMRRRMFAHIDEIRPFPQTASTLHALHDRHVTLALVTSNSLEAARRVLGDDLLALFDQRHCGTSLFGKRFKLRELLWTVRLPASAMTYIGDEIRDANAARAVGARFIGVRWGYTHPDALQAHSDTPLLQSFSELPSCFDT